MTKQLRFVSSLILMDTLDILPLEPMKNTLSTLRNTFLMMGTGEDSLMQDYGASSLPMGIFVVVPFSL